MASGTNYAALTGGGTQAVATPYVAPVAPAAPPTPVSSPTTAPAEDSVRDRVYYVDGMENMTAAQYRAALQIKLKARKKIR